MEYKRNIELIVRKKRNMEEKDIKEKNGVFRKLPISGVKEKKEKQMKKNKQEIHRLPRGLDSDAEPMDLPKVVGACGVFRKLQTPAEIMCKLPISAERLQDLDNILFEYIKEHDPLNLNQESYLADPGYGDTRLTEGYGSLRKITYKLYQLYRLIIKLMNKYKIYIFFLIIFILLLNNYFKPT